MIAHVARLDGNEYLVGDIPPSFHPIASYALSFHQAHASAQAFRQTSAFCDTI